MNKIQKHQFEPVSLLTAEHGALKVTLIPVHGQPNWIIPSDLILSIDEYHEYLWTYLWQDQEVSVYHLIPKSVTPDKLIILEGNSDVHRLALQTTGELITKIVRISDVKDVTLSKQELAKIKSNHTDVEQKEYLHQAIMLDDEMYVIPDLDLIAHHLVDLDG